MTPFKSAERRYLEERGRLARLATVGADGTPHVVPVGWGIDERGRCARSAGERAAA